LFTVESFPAPELGNSSFMVADRERGVAAVIDPLRDVDAYLSRADSLGVKVAHALDTHLHNDFVSGRRELQAEVGTDIAELPPGQEMAVGELTLRAIHTPGHTPDHLSYLLVDEIVRARSSPAAL
jgi:hydroxyacylglutathione hydrolase